MNLTLERPAYKLSDVKDHFSEYTAEANRTGLSFDVLKHGEKWGTFVPASEVTFEEVSRISYKPRFDENGLAVLPAEWDDYE